MNQLSHACEALVFRCMDFRIKPTVLAGLLAGIGYPEGRYDLVSLAGSAKGLLAPWWKFWERWTIQRQIELSTRLHGIHEILVLHHDNCGAYGITDAAQEHATQTAHLRLIIGVIGKKFPDLKVKACIVKGTASGNLTLELIG